MRIDNELTTHRTRQSLRLTRQTPSSLGSFPPEDYHNKVRRYTSISAATYLLLRNPGHPMSLRASPCPLSFAYNCQIGAPTYYFFYAQSSSSLASIDVHWIIASVKSRWGQFLYFIQASTKSIHNIHEGVQLRFKIRLFSSSPDDSSSAGLDSSWVPWVVLVPIAIP